MSKRMSFEITQSRPGSPVHIRGRAWPFGLEVPLDVRSSTQTQLPDVLWDMGLLCDVEKAIRRVCEAWDGATPLLPLEDPAADGGAGEPPWAGEPLF